MTQYFLSEISDDDNVEAFIHSYLYFENIGSHMHMELYIVIFNLVMHPLEEVQTTFPMHGRHGRHIAESSIVMQLETYENNSIDNDNPWERLVDLALEDPPMIWIRNLMMMNVF